MRLKYEKVIHHAIVNNLFGLESMKKSCNAQGSSKYYLFVTASFVNMEFIIEYYINDMEVFYERKIYQIHAGKIWWSR